MKPTLLIMAAGLGSRYGGLKQIDPVGPGGEMILDYSIYDAICAGFGKVVFIIRPEMEAVFKEIMEPKLSGRIDIDYVFQTVDRLPAGFRPPADRVKPWGTAHAVLMARPVVHEPFAVINADDFYGRDSFCRISQWLKRADTNRPDGCMAGFYIKNTLSPHGGVSRGRCEVRDGILHHIVEGQGIQRKSDGIIRYEKNGGLTIMDDDTIVSMNLWGFTPRLFDWIEQGFADFLSAAGKNHDAECQLPVLIDDLIQRGEMSVYVFPTSETWMGVTYAEDKPLLAAGIRERITAGVYPDPLSLWY